MSTISTTEFGSQASNQIPALTGVRAVAVMMVILHHAHLWLPYPDITFYHGSLGVVVFFVLSGFLISRTYAQRLASGFPLRTYFVRRWARIFPPYLFLWVVVMAAAGDWGAHRWDIPLSNFFLIQGYLYPHIRAGLGDITWSLTAEETFYLLAPALYGLMLRRLRLSAPLSVALFLTSLSLVCFGLGHWLVSLQLGPFLANEFALFFTFFGHSQFFAMGVFFALGLASGRPPLPTRFGSDAIFGAATAMACLCLAALSARASAQGQEWGGNGVVGYGIQLGFALSVAVAIWGASLGSHLAHLLLGNRVVVYLGKISYAAYLLNSELCYKRIHQLLYHLNKDLWQSMLAYSALLFFFAALIYELVEKPAHRWVVRKLSG